MNRLDLRRILITGAASGIGQATALRLLGEGAAVVAADVAFITGTEIRIDGGTHA